MNKDRICKLCFGIIFGENFKQLDDDLLKMLEILPLRLNGSTIGDVLICLECSDILKVLFNFKTSCLRNNDYLKTYIDPWQNVKLNLEDIIIKKIKAGIKCEDESVCRFCLDYFDRSLMMELNNVDVFLNMLEKCLPEIDLNVAENPLMCKNCMRLLETQFKFMSKCLNSEEKHDNFCSKEEKISWNNTFELGSKPENITINAHDIKIENINDLSSDSVNIKAEDSEEIEIFDVKIEDNIIEDRECKEKIISESNVSKASQDSTELCITSKLDILYPCTICSYQTNRKFCLNRHYRIHQNPPKAKLLYKCDQCVYATKRKANLKLHSERHKNPSELTMKKCTECFYESKYIHNLRKHFEEKHSNKKKLRKYKCTNCVYETTVRYRLKLHYKKRHKKDVKVDIVNFCCQQCDYIGKSTKDLRRHRKVHSWLHQCEYCDYKTKEMSHFKGHKMTHKSTEEVETYSCHECGFKTRYKNALVRHFKVHRK